MALDSKKESRTGDYNLQTINNFHSMLGNIAHSRKSFPPVTKRPDSSTRGKIAQGKTRSLISRFETYKDSIPRLVEDFNIEPTNNLSELSLRNSKVTQAVRKSFMVPRIANSRSQCPISTVFVGYVEVVPGTDNTIGSTL